MEYKGIKSNWARYGDYVRADFAGGSFKICEVLTKMPYPSNEEKGEAHMRLILAAPKMLEALQNLENDDNSIPDHAWIKVQSAIEKALVG